MSELVNQTDGAANIRMRVRDLEVEVADGGEKILKGINFDLEAGKIFALVGESGSGKSVTSMAAMRLLPDALGITAGSVEAEGQDLFSLPESRMQEVRGRKVAMIFQNAMTALNPVQTVGEQVSETLRLHTRLRGKELRLRVVQLFTEVGIPEPDSRFDFYPHQLSGGATAAYYDRHGFGLRACHPDRRRAHHSPGRDYPGASSGIDSRADPVPTVGRVIDYPRHGCGQEYRR